MEIRRSALLPNLLTIGNGICGFAALIRLSKIEVIDGAFVQEVNFTYAAYLVLLGMVFDVFDGKLARMSKDGGSALGAQLDSFCDLVTFGLVPSFLIVRLNLAEPQWWQNIVWFFALAYFLGALLRLARFNVESSPDESDHLAFKGLPTPAAAGCVASMVIFQSYVARSGSAELQFFLRALEDAGWGNAASFRAEAPAAIAYILAFLAPVLGFTMLSDRLKFEHMGSRLFGRRHSFDFLVYLIFGTILLAMLPEIVLPVAFFGYLLWTPARTVSRLVAEAARRRGPRPAGAESAAIRPSARVLVGLGSNLGDRRRNLERAVERVAEHEACEWVRISEWRETEPVGGPPQGNYLNGAGELRTRLSPRELLGLFQRIEGELGRKPSVRWGPRAIDLDILAYGDLVLEEEDLVIPHPRITERGFVLEPLAEVAPGWVHPVTGKTSLEHWQALRRERMDLGTKPFSGVDASRAGGEV